MSTPKGNGLVEIRGTKQIERGFNCMKLIEFLTENGVKDWDNWHGAHEQAKQGNCPYKNQCPIHEKTINSKNNII